ncbi:MAG: hypothetical protein JOY81_00705 [Alphaproteobacteria bacterium]|nr:hypothetical protein [Alphaproteobacteria bacterium]
MNRARFSALLLLTLGTLASGEALACNADEGKLQALRRGMTYQEATQVMGCEGTVVTRTGPLSGEFSTVEWNGSELAGLTRTQLDFQDGRLLSFTTGRRAGL